MWFASQASGPTSLWFSAACICPCSGPHSQASPHHDSKIYPSSSSFYLHATPTRKRRSDGSILRKCLFWVPAQVTCFPKPINNCSQRDGPNVQSCSSLTVPLTPCPKTSLNSDMESLPGNSQIINRSQVYEANKHFDRVNGSLALRQLPALTVSNAERKQPS